MLTAFRSLSLLMKVLTIVGLIGAAGGALWGVYAYIDHQGYVRGYNTADAAWQKKWDQLLRDIAQQRADERDRQDTINENAKLRERRELAIVQQQLDDLQAFNAVLQAEAALDPDRDRIAFGAAAVDRYNRFIGRTPH